MGIEIGTVIECFNNYIKIKLFDKLSVNDGIRILDKEDKGLVINKMYVNNKEVLTANKGDIITIKYDKKVSVNSKVILTTDNNKIKEIENILKKDLRKVLVDINVSAKLNEKLKISISDGVNNLCTKSDFIIEKANKVSTSKEMIIKQISKLGNTIYKLRNINVEINDNIFINIKDINNLRRKLIDLLNEKRLYKIPFKEKDYNISVPVFENKKLKSIVIRSKEEYEKYKDKYDIFYVTKKTLVFNDKCILIMPRVINNYIDYDKEVLIGEVGSVIKYKRWNANFSFNAVNSYTVAVLHNLKARRVTLSSELNVNQIKNIIDSYYNRFKKYPNIEVINDGYMEAMICKFDLNKMYGINIGYLKDEFNNKYKVVSSKDYMTIYNYKKVSKVEDNSYYSIGVNILRNNN